MNELPKLLREIARECREGSGCIPSDVGRGPSASEIDDHRQAVYSLCDELEELAEETDLRTIDLAEFIDIHTRLSRLRSAVSEDLYTRVVHEIANQ
ncbi:hypothetical protein [Ferirhizobium litorale]|uniref:hypothetical protein n=1 Tax=Ferirhizobium litorale TaxID=2927786 RepID=UPI002892B09C|nr:hypothetical protein [Fererhizobium litorale]